MTKAQKNFIHGLVKTHSAAMVQLTYRRIGDAEIAKELVQETFLTACCKANNICEHEKPVAWLYNTLNNLTRREMYKAYHTAELHNVDEELLGSSELDLSMEFLLPEELSEQERDLIILRVERGLAFSEIAELRGIKEDTCRKQVSRAIHKCRRLLQKHL